MISHILPISFFKQEQKRKRWLLVLFSIIQFILGPIVMLFDTSNFNVYFSESISRSEAMLNKVVEAFSYEYHYIQVGILMLAGLVLAIFSFKHLFSRRMIDLYHSAPITRTQLFVTEYINGFVSWFVPMIVAGAVSVLITIIKIDDISIVGPVFEIVFKNLALDLFYFLIVYNVCLVGVMLSGNAVNALINALAIGCIAITFMGLISVLAETFFNTYDHTDIISDLAFLSPLAVPIRIEIFISDSASVWKEWAPGMIMTIILLVGNFIAAFTLHEKRLSELSELGTNAKWFAEPAKLLISITNGMLLTIVFRGIAGSEGWALFGAALGSILMYGLIDIIYQVNYHVFLKNIKMEAIAIAASCVIVIFFILDIFGYDRFLPDESRIQSIEIDCDLYEDNYNRLTMFGDTSGTMFTVEDIDIAYDLLESGVNYNREAPFVNVIRIKVKLKSGYTYYRRYYIGSNSVELQNLINTEKYKNRNFPIGSGIAAMPESIMLENMDGICVEETDATRIKKILEAYSEDFNEHYSYSELTDTIRVANIELTYKDSLARNRYVYIEIPWNFTRTIDIINKDVTEIPNFIMDCGKLSPSMVIFDEYADKKAVEYVKSLDNLGDESIAVGDIYYKYYDYSQEISRFTYVGILSNVRDFEEGYYASRELYSVYVLKDAYLK